MAVGAGVAITNAIVTGPSMADNGMIALGCVGGGMMLGSAVEQEVQKLRKNIVIKKAMKSLPPTKEDIARDKDNMKAEREFDKLEKKLSKQANKSGFSAEFAEQFVANGIERYASERIGYGAKYYGPYSESWILKNTEPEKYEGTTSFGRRLVNAYTRHEILHGDK